MAPLFLTLAEVLEIHQDQIARYGGHPGIRDLGLLKSALGAPMATFAALSAYGYLRNGRGLPLPHRPEPSVRRRQQTNGTVAANVFLILNGCEFDVRPAALAQMVLAVARGELAKSDIVSLLRSIRRA